jgi:molybdopterin-containing oxidoreductase family membrane subunit
MLIVRKVYKLEAYVTVKHVEYMNIVIIVTGSIVGVAYLTELFMAWYSGVEWEQYAFLNRATGPMAWAYWIMMSCNVLSPQFFWFKKLRTSLAFTFVLSIVINIGMWFERFVIIVPTLCRTYLPSTWNTYSPSFIDVGIFVGTIGMFFTLFLLYSRTFPVIAQAELKSILKASGEEHKKAAEQAHH